MRGSMRRFASRVPAEVAAASTVRSTIHALTPAGLLILIGLGVSGTLAQLAMTRAYRTGKTLVVGSLAYSTIVFASLFGMLLWGETLGAASWMGMALIMLGGVLSLRLSPQKGAP